jgi:alanyl-tRNA synthetase
MTSEEVRHRFIDFWTSAPRSHREIPNVSLVPEVDSTLLYVNAGMFPLAPYLAGQPHPLGKRLCNVQRCLRTKYDEMLEVGDNRHTLMFEMLGNWSLGDYSRKEQIPWVLELYVEHFGLDPSRLYAAVWAGDSKVPRDEESIELWQQGFRKYGIDADFSEDITKIPSSLENGRDHSIRIFPYGKEDNWWQRGEAQGELGGSTAELFYDLGAVKTGAETTHINDSSGRFIEINNSVFMAYVLDDHNVWQDLSQQNVDFGGGLERAVMCVQGKTDIYETDLYEPVLEKLHAISGRNYKTDGRENEVTAAFRVIADHGRAATFILADGVIPSNKDQGHILRRFVRRLVRFGTKLGIEDNLTADISDVVIRRMKNVYPHLEEKRDVILTEIEKEEVKFRRTLDRGLREVSRIRMRGENIDGRKAFYIYETYGFPLEMTLDELSVSPDEVRRMESGFAEAEQAHRKRSRVGADRKFKGGLAGHADVHQRYHTATHLLLAALREVLGDHVHQQGSNITADRLRFDFNHSEALTQEEIEKVQFWVNDAIDSELEVSYKVMSKEEARRKGAECTFWERYPEKVRVYSITNPTSGRAYSVEVCGGPHIGNTREIMEYGKFRIIKEQSSSAGIRRLRAVLANKS